MLFPLLATRFTCAVPDNAWCISRTVRTQMPGTRTPSWGVCPPTVRKPGQQYHYCLEAGEPHSLRGKQLARGETQRLRRACLRDNRSSGEACSSGPLFRHADETRHPRCAAQHEAPAGWLSSKGLTPSSCLIHCSCPCSRSLSWWRRSHRRRRRGLHESRTASPLSASLSSASHVRSGDDAGIRCDAPTPASASFMSTAECVSSTALPRPVHLGGLVITRSAVSPSTTIPITSSTTTVRRIRWVPASSPRRGSTFFQLYAPSSPTRTNM